MNIEMCVALSNGNVIGNDNKLIWHLPNDLKMFKELTTNKYVVLGRKTFESIGKPLPNRTNIILSKDKNLITPGCINVSSVEEVLVISTLQPPRKLIVIGGEQIYNLFLPWANRIYITRVYADYEGDSFFPELDNTWTLSSSIKNYKDEKHLHNYDFEIWEKKKIN